MELNTSGGGGGLTPSGSAGGPPASQGGDNLADVLERVLDKGVVIAGDIQVNLLDIELLTIKLRLIVASVDTARRIGLNWWERDPWLRGETGDDDSRSLRERVGQLERQLGRGGSEELALSAGDLEEENRALREQIEHLERELEGESVGGESQDE
jgi:gas vesicle protein GvpA/GvpJ/GvpM family